MSDEPKKPSGRGGWRPGAGRKPKPGGRRKQITVTVEPTVHRRLMRLTEIWGGWTVPKVIERLVDTHPELVEIDDPADEDQ